MKWLQKRREQKRLKQHRSTRQLMGIRKVLPHGVMTSVGCLVFFQIRPDNLSVLSAEGIRQRVTALGNLFRAEEHVEILALDARESFQKIQAFYQAKGIDTVFQLNPGNHYDHAAERTAAGIAWLLSR